METILHHIWKRSAPGFVFLPIRNSLTGTWDEGEAYPPDSITAEDLEDVEPFDQYFTPTTYTAAVRDSAHVAPMGVLYADLDSGFMRDGLNMLPPSVLWETSPDSWQAVWFLAHPYPPDDALAVNRRLSLWLRADHGSWIATKVLRVPGTINYKRGGLQGTLNHIGPGVVYTLAELDTFLPAFPQTISERGAVPQVPSLDAHRTLLEKWWPKLDYKTKKLLSSAQVADRSLSLSILANKMRAISIPPQEIFGILSRLPINKFRNRPEVLWHSVVLREPHE